MMDSPSLHTVVDREYRELWADRGQMPNLLSIYERVLNTVHENISELVAGFYLKGECYEDYRRIQTSGLCREDFEILGVEVGFDKIEIMYHLDLFSYAYVHNHKIFNDPQIEVF